jgi:TRAP-type mannitol/chloroaromatic compound transport system permease small subunit
MASEPTGGHYVQKILEASAVAAWLILLVMMVWVTADVVAQALGSSLPDTIAWTEIFNVIGLSLPLAYVTMKKAHIVVDLFTLRGRAKRIRDIFGLVLVFLFTTLVAWQLSKHAWRSIRLWEFEQLTIKIYWFPAKIALALGFIGSAIVVALQFIAELRRRNRD